MAEQKINWIGKMDPNSDEAIKMFEALKKDEVANQAQLRLARITGGERFFLPFYSYPHVISRISSLKLKVFHKKL